MDLFAIELFGKRIGALSLSGETEWNNIRPELSNVEGDYYVIPCDEGVLRIRCDSYPTYIEKEDCIEMVYAEDNIIVLVA